MPSNPARPAGYAARCGPLAQLAEQWTFNPLVVGSSPTRPTAKPQVREHLTWGLSRPRGNSASRLPRCGAGEPTGAEPVAWRDRRRMFGRGMPAYGNLGPACRASVERAQACRLMAQGVQQPQGDVSALQCGNTGSVSAFPPVPESSVVRPALLLPATDRAPRPRLGRRSAKHAISSQTNLNSRRRMPRGSASPVHSTRSSSSSSAGKSGDGHAAGTDIESLEDLPGPSRGHDPLGLAPVPGCARPMVRRVRASSPAVPKQTGNTSLGTANGTEPQPRWLKRWPAGRG